MGGLAIPLDGAGLIPRGAPAVFKQVGQGTFRDGVPGIGEKTAPDLLNALGDLDAIYGDLEKVRALPVRGATEVVGVDIDEALAAKYPYQRAYLPVNRLQHDGTLWHW